MCVVNKQFRNLEFVFDSVYVDLQYDEIYLPFTAGSVSLCCVCGHVVVSRRYINVCNCDMFSVVYVYLDHLFCVVCIDGRRYICCSECNVVSNECNEPTSRHVQPIGTHGGEVMYFGCVCFRGELGFLSFVCVS